MAVRMKECIHFGLALAVALTSYVDSTPDQQRDVTPPTDPALVLPKIDDASPDVSSTDKPASSSEEYFRIDRNSGSEYLDIPISMLNASGKLNTQMIRDFRSIIEGFGVYDSDSEEDDFGASAFGGLFDSVLGKQNSKGGNALTNLTGGRAPGGFDLTTLMLGLGQGGSKSPPGVGGVERNSSSSQAEPASFWQNVETIDLVKLLQGLGLGPNSNDIENDAPGGANFDLMTLIGAFDHGPEAGASLGSGSSLGSLVGSIIGSHKDAPLGELDLQSIVGGLFAGFANKNGGR